MNLAPDKSKYSYVNLVILVTKQKIYAAKCLNKNVTKHQIVEEVNFIKQCEIQAAYTSKSKAHCNAKWEEEIFKTKLNPIAGHFIYFFLSKIKEN